MPAPVDASDLDCLRYPGERRWLRRTVALIAVTYLLATGLTLALWAGWFTLACVTVIVLRSRYPSMALEAGPDQLPREYRILGEVARAMGVPRPRLFLAEGVGKSPLFTVPLPEPALMMTASWAVMLTDEELAYFFAKELAHTRLGHRWLLNPIHVLENVGPISWFLTTPLELARYALRPWRRLAEFSADRVALACLDGRLEVAASALAKVTAGEELYHRVDGAAFLRQAEGLRGGASLWLLEVVTGKIGYGSRLAALKRFRDAPEFAALTGGAPAPRKLGWMARAGRLLAWATGRLPSDASLSLAEAPAAAPMRLRATPRGEAGEGPPAPPPEVAGDRAGSPAVVAS